MSNTNTEVLTTAYENLQKAITQANKVLPPLQEAIKKGNLDNYATNSSLEDITTTINNAISTAIVNNNKTIYPIHSTKITFNNVNPGTYITGTTWELTAKGKTLVGVDENDTDFNVAGKTGGSKTKTLGLEHMPQNLYVDAETTNGSNNKWVGETQLSNWCNRINWHRNDASQESISIVQPYITVYIWKRTA